MCQHASRAWFPRRCRKCPGCLQTKRNKTLAKILSGLGATEEHAFLTLTSRTGTPWPDIMRAWTRMVAFLREDSPFLQYAAVKEEGSSTGMRHLHVILLNFAYTPQKIISRKWFSLTSAWVVNIKRIEGQHAAAYVAKYVAKDDLPLRKKVTYSRAWPKLEPALNLTWLTHREWWNPPPFAENWTADGALVVFKREDCPCFAFARPPTMEQVDWLRSSEVRSWQASVATSVRFAS